MAEGLIVREDHGCSVVVLLGQLLLEGVELPLHPRVLNDIINVGTRLVRVMRKDLMFLSF